jgi:hypothetical protein
VTSKLLAGPFRGDTAPAAGRLPSSDRTWKARGFDFNISAGVRLVVTGLVIIAMIVAASGRRATG